MRLKIWVGGMSSMNRDSVVQTMLTDKSKDEEMVNPTILYAVGVPIVWFWHAFEDDDHLAQLPPALNQEYFKQSFTFTEEEFYKYVDDHFKDSGQRRDEEPERADEIVPLDNTDDDTHYKEYVWHPISELMEANRSVGLMVSTKDGVVSRITFNDNDSLFMFVEKEEPSPSGFSSCLSMSDMVSFEEVSSPKYKGPLTKWCYAWNRN